MARVTKPVEERRREIICVAREMFLERGFDKTQMADISKKMNVASGLIYHYFESKADLLYAVADEMANARKLEMRRLLAENNMSALDRLRLLFTLPENAAAYERFGASLVKDPAVAEFCRRKISASSLSLVIELVEQGNADGSWRALYPKETAVFILHGFFGLAQEISSYPVLPADKNEIIKMFMDIIFRALNVARTD